MLLRRLSATLCLFYCSLLQAVDPAGSTVGLTRSPISKGTLLETVAGLVFVLVIIVALGWGVKRFSRSSLSGKGVIAILGGVSLGQRERAVLIQVGETQLLVGVAPGRVQTLHVLENPISTDEESNADEGFSRKLKQVLKHEEKGT